MSLQDQFEAFEQPAHKCKVCDWRQVIDEEVREFFDTKVASNMAKMTRFCRDKYGMDADETTVRKHVHTCP